MLSIAWVRRGGSDGVNADLFRFSQPRGQVTTTSSNWDVSPVAVVNVMQYRPWSLLGLDLIFVMGWFNRILACWRAALETWCNILSYVDATKTLSSLEVRE